MAERRVFTLPTNCDATGMPVCPNKKCKSNLSKVTSTYTNADGSKRRRRVCLHCGLPFFTRQEPEPIEHVESDGA